MTVYLSASSIKDFNVCSKRYYYRIHSSGVSIKTDGMKLGTAVHKALETSWNQTIDKTYNSAIKYYQEEEGTNDIIISKKIKKCIKNYYNNYKMLLTLSDDLEKNFKLKYENAYLVGRIDRIVHKFGILIDWKTSYRDPISIDDDPQFLLYRYAYSKLYDAEPNRVLYINLFNNRVLTLNDVQDNYNKLLYTEIPYIIDRVSNNKFYRDGLDKEKVCDTCQFRDICFKDGGIIKKT